GTLLQLDAVIVVAAAALRLDGVVGNLQAGGVGELRVGNRLADSRHLGVEIGLVLPDLLRRAESGVGHIFLRIGREGGGYLGDVGCWRCASRVAVHTRSAVAGMSMWSILYSRHTPSTMALTTAGHEPIAPASPAPFTPKGLVVQGTLWVSNTKDGPSAARGSA